MLKLSQVSEPEKLPFTLIISYLFNVVIKHNCLMIELVLKRYLFNYIHIDFELNLRFIITLSLICK